MTTGSIKERFENVIEATREKYAQCYMYFMVDCPDFPGSDGVEAYGRNGSNFNLTPYVKDGALNLRIQYESIGDGGKLYFDKKTMSFTTRFGGEPVTVIIPYSCLLRIVAVNGPEDKEIVDLRGLAFNSMHFVPFWMLKEITEYIGKNRSEVPLFIGLSNEHGEAVYTQIRARDFDKDPNGHDRLTLAYPDIIGDFQYIPVEGDTESVQMTEYSPQGDTRTVHISNFFMPPPDFIFVHDPKAGTIVIDPVLRQRLENLIKERYPMMEVNHDPKPESTPVEKVKLEVIEKTEGAVQERIDVGETTEITQGNVVAVDFRNRRTL